MIQIVKHALIRHKLGLLRQKNISTQDFRRLSNEIAILMMAEITKDLPTEDVKITCWSGDIKVEQVRGKKLTLVPIMRAGFGMLDGCLALVPNAKISIIGAHRDEQSFETVPYYAKLTPDIDQRLAIIIDPMLATGGTAVHAINVLKKAGCKNIKGLFIVSAPQGMQHMQRTHPDVDIFTAAIDDGLDTNAYILPGFGDAGDRILGTK